MQERQRPEGKQELICVWVAFTNKVTDHPGQSYPYEPFVIS